MMIDKIVLVGFMASGKTTVAKLLESKLNFKSIDLDGLIENEQDSCINEIFEKRGELYFRKIEHETLKKIIASKKNIIISTGGGTPCYFDNHLLLKSVNVYSIYLKTNIDTLFERIKIKKEKDSRPLVKNINKLELKEFIAKHLFERSYYYNQADLKIETDGKELFEIVDEITTAISKLDKQY